MEPLSLSQSFPLRGACWGVFARLLWLPQHLEMSQLKCQVVHLQGICGLEKNPPQSSSFLSTQKPFLFSSLTLLFIFALVSLLQKYLIFLS